MTDQDRISRLEGVVEQLNIRMTSLENTMNSRFDAVDNRFNNVDNRFNSIENRFNNIENRIAQQFWLSVATLATVLVGAASIIVTMLLAR